jgi:hypothetical protein
MRVRVVIGSVFGVLLFVASVWLLRFGLYGWTIFGAVPALVGAAAVWVVNPGSQWKAVLSGSASASASTLLFFLLGKEGFICVLMALPLAIPFGALGGWVTWSVRHSKREAQGLALMVILPLGTLSFDASAKPQLYKVQTELAVAASPEVVWRNVVEFSTLPEPKEWVFKTGLAYPQRARIEGSGVGAVRYCEFSTGPFVEPIEVWDEPRLLRFSVTQNPAPLREWSPYGELDLPHLHGYMISKQGEFRLERLENGQTLLRGTTWYQHGLWPAEYWRWWSDAIIHRIHLRVLNHVKELAESQH